MSKKGDKNNKTNNTKMHKKVKKIKIFKKGKNNKLKQNVKEATQNFITGECKKRTLQLKREHLKVFVDVRYLVVEFKMSLLVMDLQL